MVLSCHEILDAEPLPLVCPGTLYPESGRYGQLRKLIKVIFVGALCPDALASGKRDGFPVNMNLLISPADKMHLNPAFPGIVEGIVLKAV